MSEQQEQQQEEIQKNDQQQSQEQEQQNGDQQEMTQEQLLKQKNDEYQKQLAQKQQQKIQINPLKVIWKIIQMLRDQGKGEAQETLLHQEKLLQFYLKQSEDNQISEPQSWDFSLELVDFTTNINKLAMNLYQDKGKREESVNLLIKSVDILMNKKIHKHVRPLQRLGEMKVMTFNNLAVVYQQRRQHQLALKAINFACQIEQKLVQDNYKESKFHILSSYMNKVAIQSNLSRHDKALLTLQQVLKQIENLEQQIQKQEEIKSDIQDEDQEELKEEGTKIEKDIISEEQIKKIKELKLIAYYNAGTQNEHLFHQDKAKQFYKLALQIAQEIGESDLEQKIQEALKD